MYEGIIRKNQFFDLYSAVLLILTKAIRKYSPSVHCYSVAHPLGGKIISGIMTYLITTDFACLNFVHPF